MSEIYLFGKFIRELLKGLIHEYFGFFDIITRRIYNIFSIIDFICKIEDNWQNDGI